MHNVDLTDKLWPPLLSHVIFVISDRPTLTFQKTYHYNGLKRPYEIKYILYLLYKFDLLVWFKCISGAILGPMEEGCQ